MMRRAGHIVAHAALLGALVACGSSADESAPAAGDGEKSGVLAPAGAGGAVAMTEAEPLDLSSWELEPLAEDIKQGHRLAVVGLLVDRAELRNVGTRSQQLVLGGETTSVAAGEAPDRIDALFYHAEAEHPQPGDTVIAVLDGTRSGDQTLWMIVRFQPTDPAAVTDVAGAVASRLRSLASEDPFRPFG